MTFVARRPTAEVLAVLLDHLIGLSHHVPGFPLLVTVMTPEEFQQYYPRLLGWIDTTLRAHSANARTVTSRGFPRCRFTSLLTHWHRQRSSWPISCHFPRCHHGD